jgi:hypothetical protein
MEVDLSVDFGLFAILVVAVGKVCYTFKKRCQDCVFDGVSQQSNCLEERLSILK